jgi:hypothetical protein
MRLHAILFTSLVACSGGGDETTDETTEDTGSTGNALETFIYTTETATGSRECYTPGDEWNTQTVDASLVSDYTFGGVVEDFESGDAVVRDVEFWLEDSVAGAPDITATSASDGTLNVSLPSCQPFTYRTSSDDDSAKITYEAHQIYDVPEGGNISDSLNSVSDITYRLIPSILGVSVDADKGVIAGTAFDCNGDAIENAQVVVKDANGEIPEALVVNYFVDSFPNRDQEWTSADGLWVAANVPEGDLTVELYIYNGSGHDLIGITTVPSVADTINISNVYEGFGDGVKYPDGCLAQGG